MSGAKSKVSESSDAQPWCRVLTKTAKPGFVDVNGGERVLRRRDGSFRKRRLVHLWGEADAAQQVIEAGVGAQAIPDWIYVQKIKPT